MITTGSRTKRLGSAAVIPRVSGTTRVRHFTRLLVGMVAVHSLSSTRGTPEVCGEGPLVGSDAVDAAVEFSLSVPATVVGIVVATAPLLLPPGSLHEPTTHAINAAIANRAAVLACCSDRLSRIRFSLGQWMPPTMTGAVRDPSAIIRTP